MVLDSDKIDNPICFMHPSTTPMKDLGHSLREKKLCMRHVQSSLIMLFTARTQYKCIIKGLPRALHSTRDTNESRRGLGQGTYMVVCTS